jgi:phenylalanyl-tRNA synthetase beta chain
MIVSYRWLKDVAPGLSLTPNEVAERLALRGAPIEGMDDLGLVFTGLQVARVVQVDRHPDADRLSLCQVDAGGDDHLQVICGAPNVRAGAWYPFAPVGARLPDGMKIKKVKIRGVHSVGMLCSERELGLGRDHAGILELEGDFHAGQPLTDALGLDDVRLDVEVSPNRGDLLSHLGVARELAPGGDAGVTLPAIPGGTPYDGALVSNPVEVQTGDVRIRIDEPELCRRFLAVVIRGVRIGPSPPWLANRLRAVGAQPINNVVDVTNYAMLEMGHPMHAYDLAKLGGSAIVVRRAVDGEKLETLDGVTRTLRSDMLAICDAREPVGIGGIMGGGDSEVSDETVDVLLECALFEPANIRATRRTLDMSTDASYRFERGVDPAAHEGAIRRGVELVVAVAGGEPDGQILDVCPSSWSPSTVSLRPSRVGHLLGVEFEPDTLEGLLTPLGFEVARAGDDALSITVPGFRSYDVRREVDLIEEVARTYGYDAFPEDLGAFRPGTVPDHPLFQLEDRLRDLLAGRGLLEVQIPAFCAASEGEVALSNPISSNDSHMRRWLIPGLVRRVAYNFARGNRTIRLFELGTSFRRGDGQGSPPEEATHLAVALTGSREPSHWTGNGDETDVWELKGIAEAVARAAYGSGAAVVPGTGSTSLVEGQVLEVRAEDGRVVGEAGSVPSAMVDAPAWAGAVWALEMELPPEPVPMPAVLAEALPEFPGVDRDLALMLSRGVSAADVRRVIGEAGVQLLSRVEVFDLYEGDELPHGYRSVAHRLRFQSTDRTLTDDEVERALSRIRGKLKEELGVEARG